MQLDGSPCGLTIYRPDYNFYWSLDQIGGWLILADIHIMIHLLYPFTTFKIVSPTIEYLGASTLYEQRVDMNNDSPALNRKYEQYSGLLHQLYVPLVCISYNCYVSSRERVTLKRFD